jgi:hypothetical protein
VCFSIYKLYITRSRRNAVVFDSCGGCGKRRMFTGGTPACHPADSNRLAHSSVGFSWVFCRRNQTPVAEMRRFTVDALRSSKISARLTPPILLYAVNEQNDCATPAIRRGRRCRNTGVLTIMYMVTLRKVLVFHTLLCEL